jgi:F1F0 ATPase subunit 2
MPDIQILIFVFAVGALLGTGFFGTLWWTVRRGIASARPALWFLGGLVLRMAITFYGFYLAGGTEWQRWLACLAGFVLARLIVGRLIRAIPAPLTKEAHHAS